MIDLLLVEYWHWLLCGIFVLIIGGLVWLWWRVKDRPVNEDDFNRYSGGSVLPPRSNYESNQPSRRQRASDNIEETAPPSNPERMKALVQLDNTTRKAAAGELPFQKAIRGQYPVGEEFDARRPTPLVEKPPPFESSGPADAPAPSGVSTDEPDHQALKETPSLDDGGAGTDSSEKP